MEQLSRTSVVPALFFRLHVQHYIRTGTKFPVVLASQPPASQFQGRTVICYSDYCTSLSISRGIIAKPLRLIIRLLASSAPPTFGVASVLQPLSFYCKGNLCHSPVQEDSEPLTSWLLVSSGHRRLLAPGPAPALSIKFHLLSRRAYNPWRS